jgi:uncharacterized repeat protein (TIGR03803 family)
MQLQNHLTTLASMLLLCLVTLSISAQTYQVVYYFDGSNGANPWTSPVLAGDTLYGTMGGPGQGAVFKVGTNGSGYAILHTFTGPDGAAPYGDLMVSGTTLYGSTYVNGANGGGTVFKVNTDGSEFTVLKAFFREALRYPAQRCMGRVLRAPSSSSTRMAAGSPTSAFMSTAWAARCCCLVRLCTGCPSIAFHSR